MQEVLEKFEYFPIKCRVQRTTEAFALAYARAEADVKIGAIASKVSSAYIADLLFRVIFDHNSEGGWLRHIDENSEKDQHS
jgi:hypothetical protein